MLDPVTFATTFITLATFIKDLIDLGEGIQSSIEKVGENRREVWELLQDVDHTLHDLASLTKGKENIFRGPELLVALENLKAEMLHVHSKCLAVSPAQLPGFRRIGSQFKAWRRRENLEKRVTRLRERVNKCYLQFTAISAARTEHATWRIEQTLILDNVETQVKVRRLEGMMAQLLLESDFGRLKINNTMEIISTDSSFSTLESQYLSAQLRSLINTLNQLLLSGRLLSESPLWDNDLLQFEFLEPSRVTPSHTLVQILRIIVEIKSQANPSVLLELLKLAMEELPICLGCIGMHSEAIVWGHLEIDFLRHTARTGHSTGTLPRVASALCEISLAHYRRANFDSAAEFSQQSLAIWVQISHMLPEVDNGIGLLESLVTHAKILLERDDQTALLSAAQEAASLGHSLAKTLIEAIALGGLPLTSHEEFTAVCCYDSFFMLGHVLASLDRLLDSYNSFKEGFQTACSLPVSGAPPPGKCINEFIEVVCKLADSGRLSLRMLVDIVVLFWNLTRVHCEQFSHKFLRLLHAFAYFMQQYHSPSSIIRLFLIPKSNHPPPGLDLAKPIRIDLCVLEDAVKIFFTEASEEYTIPLIGNIWVAHFQQAINTLQTQRLSLDLDSFEWVLHTTREILPFLSKTNYVALLRVLSVSIEHLRTNFVTPIPERELYFVDPIEIICKHALKIGAVDEGLRLCEQITEYLECQSHTNQNADPWLGWFLRLRIFILCDGTRFFDAIQLVQHTEAVLPTSASNGGAGFLNYYLVKARILGRLGRHKEALHFVRKGVASVLQVFKTNGPFFNLHFYLLCIEQAAVGSCMGIQQTALADAERAVVACQEVNIKGSVEEISCVQIHSLTTLSNCLASIGRDDEALNAAQKAVSLYTPNAEEMWKDFVFTIRRQELGGNTFFALSRRLETSGDKESALSSCEKAIELYHELVSLAPRHLPTLASSLQHMASILWDLGRQQEAMAASMEGRSNSAKGRGLGDVFPAYCRRSVASTRQVPRRNRIREWRRCGN
ncbi:Tetratricopeptide repeat family [Favolaschia claudopus]|uniref:Tetratricopeptide repeat family n=1 Tax=Favolaschia claudopus TaxID=2862362 RepID=A0AAW0A622_9AGAR